MQSDKRCISIDVCDYTKKPLCNLYDNTRDVVGQAVEVYKHSERNGYKELNFQLPSVCIGENGEEENYRLRFLISDYKLKFQKKNVKSNTIETDWFLISEPGVTHQAFSKNYDVKAKHISTLLGKKKLDLEFSDEEGNNVGTIEQIAEVILEGTDWHLGNVAKFYEDKKYGQTENIEKVRSFNSSAGVGALKMMSDLCDLFDAKAVYNGEAYYDAYNVVGMINDVQQIYRENCDIYEATKAVSYATDEGWTNVEIIYVGKILGQTVDISPMNPFSKDLEEGQIPSDVVANKVIELYYNKNVKSIKKHDNTDNLITRLSAYGAYGDRTGMCSLQKATHEILHLGGMNSTLTITPPEVKKEFKFEYNNQSYFFCITDTLVNPCWSSLDYASRSYVYDFNHNIVEVTKESVLGHYTVLANNTVTIEENCVPFLMDFSYYRKVGLLTDEMLQSIANFQITIPEKYKQAEQSSIELSDTKEKLFRTAYSDGGFLKFDVSSGIVESDPTNINYGQLVLTLDKTNYQDGIIYRSDYGEAKRNRFSWNVAEGIKDNGMSIGGTGAVVYMIDQQTVPTSWTKTYVKMLGNGVDNYFYDSLGNYYKLHIRAAYDKKERLETDDVEVSEFPVIGIENTIYVALDTGKMYIWTDSEYREIKACSYDYGLNKFDEPTTVTLWCADSQAYSSNDIVYMFSSDSLSGLFGPREDAIYSNRESIEKTIETVTERHPLIFLSENDVMNNPDDIVKNSYGWCYRSYLTDPNKYDFGDLYFCYGQSGDTVWNNVYVSKGGENPEKNPLVNTDTYSYYYNIRRGMLYKAISGHWQPLDKDATDDKRVMAAFASVISGCINQEKLTKGVHETYTYTLVDDLPIGHYAFVNEFGTYWLFTTDRSHSIGDTFIYNTSTKVLWQDTDEHNILKPKEYTFDVLVPFPIANEMGNAIFTQQGYNDQTHVFEPTGLRWVSQNIYVYENTIYQFNLPNEAKVVFFDSNGKYIDETLLNECLVPNHTSYIRVITAESAVNPITDAHYVRVKDYNSCFFVENIRYNILQPTPGGETSGIYDLMDRFVNLSDDAYLNKLVQLRIAQNKINQSNVDLMRILGDIYREGRWQQNDYVEGDENKLYADSLDNLKEVSRPESTYDIDYLELFGTEKNVGLSIDGSTEDIDYPDIDTTWAAHLVDMEIDTNKWAYLDSVDTCYDQPKKTKIEINTKLSLIGQQSFTDVIANIAEVSNETKSKQSLYKRAGTISSDGKVSSSSLEGVIQTSSVAIAGSTSNWHTDPKGNMIFESADGESAIMITGQGLMISQEKDMYGDWVWTSIMTGKGLSANAIRSGYISADRIESGSITADKISSSFGNDLDIATNKALNLFATIDGSRPAGALETAHPSENDSWISIQGKTENDPARIVVKSGGSIDIEGGTLNLTSAADATISAGGKLVIDGGDFLVNTPKFKIFKDQYGEYFVTINGSVVTTDGEVAGYKIGSHTADPLIENDYSYVYMYAGSTQYLYSEEPGVYIGTDGFNLGGKLIYYIGKPEDPDNPSTLVDSNLEINANSICVVNGEEDDETISFSADADCVYLDSVVAFNINGGQMNIVSEIDASFNGAIKIEEENVLDFVIDGQVKMGTSITYEGHQKRFIIDGKEDEIRIFYGMTEFDDTENDGIYFGTDGFAMGAGKFNITPDGYLTSVYGNIAGWEVSPSILTAFSEAEGYNTSIIVKSSPTNHDNIFNIVHQEQVESGNTTVTMTYEGGITTQSHLWFETAQIGGWHFNSHQKISGNIGGPDNIGTYTELTGDNGSYGIVLRSYHSSITSGNGKLLEIGATSASTRSFSVSYTGVLTATGTVTSASSIEYKHNISDLQDSLIIDDLRPVSFVYNDDKLNKNHFGLIYEEVEQLIPEVCYVIGDKKTINYVELVPMLIKEIQSLRKRVKNLERT